MKRFKPDSIKDLLCQYDKALRDARASRQSLKEDFAQIEELRKLIKVRIREMVALDGLAENIRVKIVNWKPEE